MRHFPRKIQKFQVFFSKKNVLPFLSLKYSADFRRFRRVTDKLFAQNREIEIFQVLQKAEDLRRNMESPLDYLLRSQFSFGKSRGSFLLIPSRINRKDPKLEILLLSRLS